MILVIGGAGYIGSHMVKYLRRLGEPVLVMDNLENGHRQALLDADFVQGDLRQQEDLERVFREYPVDCVMHFAAYASVGDSVLNPSKYYDNNVRGCLTLLEAMRTQGIRQMVFSSSAAVYGEPQVIPIPEEHSKNPTNPYGETKWVMERMLQWYGQAYGIQSVSLRYFNAAGADPEGEIGEDHRPEEHLIPVVLLTALGQQPQVKVFGTDWNTPDGTCIRDFIHVWDLAAAHWLAILALRSGAATSAYNLGNAQGFSVNHVIHTVEQITKLPVRVEAAPRRPGDPARLVASNARIQADLNWQPKYPTLETIIQHAWNWRQRHPAGYS